MQLGAQIPEIKMLIQYKHCTFDTTIKNSNTYFRFESRIYASSLKNDDEKKAKSQTTGKPLFYCKVDSYFREKKIHRDNGKLLHKKNL